MSHRYQSTQRLAGHKRTVRGRTDLPERALTIIWPIRTTSPRLTCSYIVNIGRLGRSKSCFGHGSRSGDRTQQLKPFVSIAIGLTALDSFHTASCKADNALSELRRGGQPLSTQNVLPLLPQPIDVVARRHAPRLVEAFGSRNGARAKSRLYVLARRIFGPASPKSSQL